MLSGAEITDNVVEADKTHELAALQRNGQLMHLSPSKQATYKLELRRNQAFNRVDSELIKSVLREIVSIYDSSIALYRNRVISYAIEVGLCRFLSAAHSKVLVDVLQAFDEWSVRTYEGRKPTFSIVVEFDNKQTIDEQHPPIKSILREDFSALLSNSAESALVISAYGALHCYATLPITSYDNIYSPLRFVSFANHATEHKICLTLTNNGDILIFKDQKLSFAKRNGKWSYYNHESIMKKLGGGAVELRKALYATILDVSFARTGGCIAAIALSNVKRLIVDDGLSPTSTIKRADILKRPTSIKSNALSRLIQERKFQDIDRVSRKELVGIDGATIVDNSGNVIAAGAIIKIDGGSTGGGRLAATKTLAPYGIAVKVSADGMVKAFTSERGTSQLAFEI
ncbi:hypothetical protein [Hymenobacter jeollabukensis]|uniref:DAC domain-containing protein n=1 Tax=Hymenobacter jeollabukensis TaxID=2025313 RepID=A0A5R8WQ03_9BACT|nr:hypothetical protein [Hymenobacter jeollabukensis]TLM92368.1 hypothetical protein FDY95_13125 [Hymenobacter jeollabukensis]